ncbi:S8 family peptidase [Alkalihalobacterium elongatum]|uniref:S8 family peptidase n=1 Tax=Alkalihalobacterium elongatum TaxID=2675466 RepID=UPI001C1F2CC5|nr:S8 family serine peptidase [Alkalihalobacterium elongatum]
MKKIFTMLLCFVLMMSVFPAAMGAATDTKDGYYSVLFNQKSVPASFENQVKSLGGEIVYSVPQIGFVQVKAPTTSFNKLRGLAGLNVANPSLSWSVPESLRITEDTVNPADAALWDLQWDIQRITENGASFELGTGSHDVVVGVVDTGIDRTHPDLVPNLLPGSKNFVPAGGFRGTEPEEEGDREAFDDTHGHGSHVAGSIAGNGAMLGVAPDTGIKAYRVFGTSSAESAWIYDAMITAADDEVDVISMSLGGFDILGQVFYTDPKTGKRTNLGNDVADFKAYKRAVEYVTKKGVLVVVAAGNEELNATNKREVTNFLNEYYAGDGYSFVGAGFEVPGSIPGVVTVSATGQNDVLANYSNYGPGFIDIAAVGGDIKLYEEYFLAGKFNEYIANRLFETEFNLSASEDGGYYWSVGTSMATPKVSAVAALLIDKHGKMSPAKLQDLLYKTAVDPVRGKDQRYFGSGHLNAYNALR